MDAICVMMGPKATGTIVFQQKCGKKLTICGNITGLTPGNHGLHVHTYGDLSNGCLSTGPHYNPRNKNHGNINDKERHVGDLGNIFADGQGVAKFCLEDVSMKTSGSESVLGRALVVHAMQDDLGKGGNPESLLTGNSGARVGCGVIGIKNPAT